jgi:predicted PurR-regulated permease PerM
MDPREPAPPAAPEARPAPVPAPAPAAAAPAAAPVRRMMYEVRHSPVSVSVVLMAAAVSIYFLQWAQAFFAPLAVGIILAFALNPLVNRIQRLRLPRALAAAVVMGLVVGGTGTLVYTLHDEALEMIDQLPAATTRFAKALKDWRRGPPGTFSKVREAAAAVERAASEATTVPTQGRAPMRVQLETRSFHVQDLMWSGSAGAFAMAWQLIVVLFLVFFLLVTGDALKRKVVKVAGTTLKQRRVTVVVLDEVGSQIQKALLVMVVTNVLLGVATWLAFTAMGIERAGLWGLIAGVLHLVPYFGSAFVAVAAALAGLLQFNSWPQAFATAGATLFIATVIGMFLMPWLQGRASRMNPAAVFVGLLFWGWLWGMWGLLLATPILAVFKVICDHVEQLQPVAELMSS